MHEMTTRGWIFAISSPNACLFGGDEAVRDLWNETPGVVVTVSEFGLVGAKGNPTKALIRYIFDNSGLDRTVKDSEAIESALAYCARRLACNVFDDHEPVRPIGSVGEPRENTVTI
jgi:hypothetical protein